MTETFLNAIMKSEGPVTAVLDPVGVVSHASPEFARLTAPDIVGRDIADFINGLDLSKLTEGVHRLSLRDERGGYQALKCRLQNTDLGRVLIGAVSTLVHSDLLETKAQLENELTTLNRKLQQNLHDLEHAQSEVKTLAGLLPICSYCKKIRDDRGYWASLERYFSTHSDILFSHGICEECVKSEFAELDDEPDDGL